MFSQVSKQYTVFVLSLDLDSQFIVSTDPQQLLAEWDVPEHLSLGHLEGDALLVAPVVEVQYEEGFGLLIENAEQVVLGWDALVHECLAGCATIAV